MKHLNVSSKVCWHLLAWDRYNLSINVPNLARTVIFIGKRQFLAQSLEK